MVISEITTEDIDELKELQPEGWPDITPNMNFYIQSSFCKPIKILSNRRIAGIGAAIFHTNSAWLGHIIVHKDFRNRGIGAFVTKSLLQMIEKTRYLTVSLIATDMGEPVYRKLGFQKTDEYHFYRKDSPATAHSPSDHIQNGLTYSDQILSLDLLAAGEDRHLLLKGHLPGSKVFVDEGKVKGFYLPGLGDGLIAAQEENAGLELLKLHLNTKSTCVLPEENYAAIEHLRSDGFEYVKQGARMSIGRTLLFQPKMLYSRIAGNVG